MKRIKKDQVHKAFSELGKALYSIESKKKVFGSYFYLKQYEELHLVTAKTPGDKLLDWGAGYGHFSFIQSSLGKEVFAYSPEEDEYTLYTKTLDELSDKAGFKYQLSKEPILLPYNDNAFDIVVSCGVLEHVREFGGDDKKSLDEIYRILVKGGKLVIGHLPNTGSWIETYSRKNNRPHHEFLYTKKEIKDKVLAAGFVIEKHKRYGVLPKNSLSIKTLKYKNDNSLVKLVANLYYGIDKYILSKLFPSIAQNHLLVLVKPK